MSRLHQAKRHNGNICQRSAGTTGSTLKGVLSYLSMHQPNWVVLENVSSLWDEAPLTGASQALGKASGKPKAKAGRKDDAAAADLKDDDDNDVVLLENEALVGNLSYVIASVWCLVFCEVVLATLGVWLGVGSWMLTQMHIVIL